MAQNKNFLETNENPLEQSLRIVRNDFEDDLNKYFGGAGATAAGDMAPARDYKVITPQPGFCIKTFKVNTNEKYFINVCQTDQIPAPEDITEEQLSQILHSEEPSAFRIPMSISDPRITKDKSNNPVDVCDIAINKKFFAKCQKSTLFKEFFLALIAEALSDKYNVQIKIDRAIILNNRKFIGTLVSHRVRNTDVKTVLQSYKNPSEADKRQLHNLEKGNGSKLIEEINEKDLNQLKERSEQFVQNSAKIKQDISLASCTVPEHKLRVKLNDAKEVEEFQAEFYLPKCISSNELTLDIGDDRILLESMKHRYLFDKFVNYDLIQQRAKATFNKANKMLQIRIPVKSR